jgi:predicted nuclease of predicted toxin-antitoxin system
MRLYVDDDLAQPLLAALLIKAGHDVRLPKELGLTGAHDAVHLRNAVRETRVFLSGNYRDFEFLHDLILETVGHHPGILIVRRDNDPTRDLSPRGIVRAIGNLALAKVPLQDQYIILNHWR